MREVAGGVEVTDGSGTTTSFDAVVIATHPAHALAMLESPTALQRELLSACPTAATRRCSTPMPRCCRTPPPPGRRGTSCPRRPAQPAARVTVTYDLTRLQRLPTDTHYLVTLGGEDLVDPATVIDRMEYEHPLYTPESVAAVRRLPEINTDRIAFAGAYHGWGFHEDGARSGLAAATHLGLPWTRTTHASSPSPDASRRRSATPVVRRCARTFEHSSTFWLVDLDDLPDHGRLASFEARDHLGVARATTLRTTSRRCSADNGVSLGAGDAPGTILMAAHPRSLGHSFNPISVFWCFDDAGEPGRRSSSRCTTPTATATPTSSTPTSRAAPAPTRRCTSRPSTAWTARTTSPCPLPTDRLAHRGHPARPRRRQVRPLQRQPHRRPQRRPGPQDPRRSTARQRADPSTRHLAVGTPTADPSAAHPPTGGGPMTLEKNHLPTESPDTRQDTFLDQRRRRSSISPHSSRSSAARAPPSPRPSPAASSAPPSSRLAVTVVEEPTDRGRAHARARAARPCACTVPTSSTPAWVATD